MEELIKRFPSIAQDVQKELDNRSLTKCKEVSPLWNDSVDNKKEIWLRRIRLRSGKFEEFRTLWNAVISKTSVERVKALSLAVQNFFEENLYREDQFTPHHVVAAYGSKELYEYIANKTGQIDNRTSRLENTALHYSAEFGNVGVFQFLIENSDDKNPRNIDGITPLHYAARQQNIETKHGRLEICKAILAHVTDKNPRNNIGDTVLHIERIL